MARFSVRPWLVALALAGAAGCPNGTDGGEDPGPVMPDAAADPGQRDTPSPDPGQPDAGQDDVPEVPDEGPELPDDVAADVPPDIPSDPGSDAGVDAHQPVCGDGKQEGDEECDDGEANSNETPNACREDCKLPWCGDGVPDDGEECDDGNQNEFDGCTTECVESEVVAVPEPGEVVITELMVNPEAVADPTGEWIELVSLADEVRNLGPCVLHDDGTDSVPLKDAADTALVLEAGARVVLGFSDDPAVNGGVGVDFVYSTMLLDNVQDEVVLTCGLLEIDRVAYSSLTFPLESGHALSLDPDATDAAANDDGKAWCAAELTYGDGDFGTPGDANPSCPPPDLTVDHCVVTNEMSVDAFLGFEVEIAVEIGEPKITDFSSGVDAHPDLVVEVGYGAVTADPATGWTWLPAAGIEGWQNEAGIDGYSGAIAFAQQGSLLAAARASKDGGATWVYCDRGAGSADGFQPEDAVHVQVGANPCEPNPCTDAPADGCAADLVTVLLYPDEGSCVPISSAEYDCLYDPLTTNCASGGQMCADASCVDGVPAPSQPGDLVVSEIMVWPTVDDYLGEWIEVINTTATPLDLDGCELKDADIDTHLIAGPLVIPANGYLVLGRQANGVVNGGVELDYAFGDDIVFDKPYDEIEIHCDGTLIDAVSYGPTWAIVMAKTLSLSPYEVDAAANDDKDAWCKPGLDQTYGDGDFGTPGEANAPCPDDQDPIDACFVIGPPTVGVSAGVTTTFTVRVSEAVITPATFGTDPHPDVLAEGGWGPDGSQPGDDWTWTAAEPDMSWDAQAAGAPLDQDQYLATLRAPPAGEWDLAFRASADGGNTWTACDMDGVDNGYQPDQSMALISSGSACDPDPCGEAAATVCEDAVVVAPVGDASCLLDAASAAVCSWGGDVIEDCGELGASCEAGACVDFPTTPTAGDVVISELMIAPTQGFLGEWIELANASDVEWWTLAECTLAGGAGESWAFADHPEAPLLVAPGTTYLLARSADPSDNDGIDYDAIVDTIALGYDADTVSLSCAGQLVDGVTWDASWAIPTDVPLSLSGNRVAGADNDLPEHWCPGAGGAPAGTPGAANPICPPPDTSPDECLFVSPTSSQIDAGGSVEVHVWLQDFGTTDATSGVDEAPGVVAQVGFGPWGSDPDADAGWSWFDGFPDGAWNDQVAPDFDQYLGTISTQDQVGTWAMAARFSLDGGLSWTACDTDGAANGYDPAQAAMLTLDETDCAPNPCTTPPASTCDGDLMVVWASPGTCTLAAPGSPDCSYQQLTFDCAAFGGCAVGACVDVVAPALEGDLIVTEFLANSADPGSDQGEWIEVYNPTASPLDLRGCTLSDADGSHAIDGTLPVVVASGGFFVLAGNDDTATNGGLVPDYVYDGLALSNVFDQIELSCGATLIDAVAYGVGWPIFEAQSTMLSGTALAADLNDDPANWCAATAPYGDGSNTGRPGNGNGNCP